MMLEYYLRIALKSVTRTKLTTAIVVSSLGLGIGIAMAFVTVLHVLSQDPLPEKSETLFYVQLDSWTPDSKYPGRAQDELPIQVTYQDAMALSRSNIPSASSVHYVTWVVIRPDGSEQRPFLAHARAARSDFFSMFQAPFAMGRPWDDRADESREALVVLSKRLSERLFGSIDSVGKIVSIANRPFSVIGVLDTWQPSMRPYDLIDNPWTETEELFLPFDTAIDMELAGKGNTDNWKPEPSIEGLSNFQASLRGERCWLQFYVELESAEQRARFLAFIDDYTRAQKAAGRFRRPIQNRLSTIPEVVRRWELVPNAVRVLRVVSLLFLFLCILSVIGLLLGHFLTRSHEVGIRRALGASRWAVFYQHLVESSLLGFGGGVLGTLVSLTLLSWIQSVLPPQLIIDLTMTAPLLGVAFLVAIGSGIAAGLYPAWRICSTPVADHLKA